MNPKQRCILALISVLAVCWTLPAWAGDGGLSDDERTHLVTMLEDSRSELESLVAGVSADDWNRRTDPESWAVGEVVEHLILAEEAFLGMLTGALAGDEDPDWQVVAANGVEGVVNMVQDRAQKFQAPEGLVPSGELSRDEALTRYASARIKMLDLVRSTQAPVKKFTIEGPPGTMNVQQWMALAGAHNLRHNRQIADGLEALAKR